MHCRRNTSLLTWKTWKDVFMSAFYLGSQARRVGVSFHRKFLSSELDLGIAFCGWDEPRSSSWSSFAFMERFQCVSGLYLLWKWRLISSHCLKLSFKLQEICAKIFNTPLWFYKSSVERRKKAFLILKCNKGLSHITSQPQREWKLFQITFENQTAALKRQL